MKHKTLAAKRFLIVFLVCTLSFGGVATAYAAVSLTSIAVDSIGAIAAAEISCHKDDIMQGIQDIFGGSDSGSDEVGSMGSDSVPIAVAKDSKQARETAKAAAIQANDTTCTKTVEKAAAQVILKQLTVATVNWINHGFKGGSSFFPKDTQSFLKAIGDQTAERFIGTIGYDKKNFPFGKAVAQDIARSISSSFEQNAAFSLDRVLAMQYPGTHPPTAGDFYNSFQEGGWAAFEKEFRTENNPIGFTLASKSELQQRTQSAQYNPAQDIKDQLARSGGFLDTSVCVAPSTYVEGSSDDLRAKAEEKLKTGKWETESEYQDIQRTIKDNTCTKTAKQTPGSIVSGTLTKALNSPFDQLTNSPDLNASLTAIFDALANQLMQKGLSSLESSTKDDATYENNGSFVNPALDVEDGLGNPDQNGSWLQGAEGFNMFKDIPSIILNEDFTPAPGDVTKQEGYQQVLQKQVEAATRLIPAIYELDFCVPGPHPGWRGDTSENVQRFVNDEANIPQNADSAIGGTNVVLNKILDPMNALNLTAATKDKREEDFFSGLLSGYLSYHLPGPKEDNFHLYLKPDHPVPSIVGTAKNSKTNGHNAAVNVIRTLYNRYADLLEHVYSPEENQEIANKLALDVAVDTTEFNSIKKYMSAIADNKALITGSIATVSQLNSLQKRIDLLPTLDGYVAHNVGNSIPANGIDEAGTVATTEQAATGLNGTTSGGTTGGTTKTPKARTVVKDRAYWIYQDYLGIQGKPISELKTDYERELRRIGGAFDIIAPKIHSISDLTKQESVLSAVLDKQADFTSPGGYLDECIKETSDPTYKGPTYRLYFPQTVVKNIPKTPTFDGPMEFTKFEMKFKDVGISFLPYVHYAQGQGEDQKPYFNSKFGQQTEENTIQNDDVVTIGDQPQQDALSGLEALINIY